MDISLITSLYRTEKHLPQYVEHVLRVANIVHDAGIQLEIVVVANDASELERELLLQLEDRATQAGTPAVRILHVEREFIAKSWNRGLAAITAPYFGFWNVDDIRDSQAVIAGFQALRAGADLVDFEFDVLTHTKILGLFPRVHTKIHPIYFEASELTPRIVLGTFFLAAKSLAEQVGGFDPNMRVAQDFEFTAATRGMANFEPVYGVNGGQFIIHGGNLSNTRSIHEMIEVNIVLMRRGKWQYIRPTPDPEAMQTAWEEWGNVESIQVPSDVATKLWGPDAFEIYQQWEKEYDRLQRMNRIRVFPRRVIDSLGLRPVLAKLGIVQPQNQS